MLSPTTLSAFSTGVAQSGLGQPGPVQRVRAAALIGVGDECAEQSGQEVATIERDADRDRWFTAEQAVDYGLVDGIIRTTTDIRPAADRGRIGLGLGAGRPAGSGFGAHQGSDGRDRAAGPSAAPSDRAV